MGYSFSVICVVLATTLCVNSYSKTLRVSFTPSRSKLVKSERGVSPQDKLPWVQSALKKLAEQCFLYDVSHGACNASSQPLLCNNRYLDKPTKTKRKILFIVCRQGVMCKFIFVTGPGVVNTIKKESIPVAYRIYQARYHQTLNTVYWTKRSMVLTIYSTIASGEKRKKYNHIRLPSIFRQGHQKSGSHIVPMMGIEIEGLVQDVGLDQLVLGFVRVVSFDIDSKVNCIFILSDQVLSKYGVSTHEFANLTQGKFYRTDSVFLDKYKRCVYYTCRCTSSSRQDLMRISYDGKAITRIASALTRVTSFVVDESGWEVFVCSRHLHRYNVNTSSLTLLVSVSTAKCSGMTSDGPHIYVPARGKMLVLSMDSGEITSILHVPTRNHRPETYLPVIVPDPN